MRQIYSQQVIYTCGSFPERGRSSWCNGTIAWRYPTSSGRPWRKWHLSWDLMDSKEEKEEYRVQRHRGEREGLVHSGNWKSTVTRRKARLKGGEGQAWSKGTAGLEPDNEGTCLWWWDLRAYNGHYPKLIQLEKLREVTERLTTVTRNVGFVVWFWSFEPPMEGKTYSV